MWIVFLAEIKYGLNFTDYSLYPRKFHGLLGVITAPFIHLNGGHIGNNSVSFLVLMSLVMLLYRNSYLKIFVIGLFLSGIITWLIARPAYHLGMSGVIYMLSSFLITKGFFSKQYNVLAVAFMVIFVYGGLVWYIFPIDPSISWEGHLSGVISGLLLGFFIKNEVIEPVVTKTPSSQALFLNHFTKEGKFVANLPFLDENGNLILEEEE